MQDKTYAKLSALLNPNQNTQKLQDNLRQDYYFFSPSPLYSVLLLMFMEVSFLGSLQAAEWNPLLQELKQFKISTDGILHVLSLWDVYRTCV